MEKLLPSYRLTVTVSCLKAIRRLQKFGHLPSDASVFKSYAVPGNFADVRLAALDAMIDFTKGQLQIYISNISNHIDSTIECRKYMCVIPQYVEVLYIILVEGSSDILNWLLEIVDEDPEPMIR